MPVTVTLNLLAAAPPFGGPGALIPVGGPLGIAGSVAMVGALGAALVWLRRVPDRLARTRSASR